MIIKILFNRDVLFYFYDPLLGQSYWKNTI